MKIPLPPAPKQHDQANQNNTRNQIRLKLDELVRRVMKLEGR